MHDLLVEFTITNLQAQVVEDVGVAWEGKEFKIGPLNVELDKTAGSRNAGVLDYGSHRALAAFHVLLSFPIFASTLDELGVDPELTRPLHAVIHSQGNILDDHSFVLSGPCDLIPHPLLKTGETMAAILPGT